MNWPTALASLQWPEPTSVKVAMPPEPDADIIETYLCFIEDPQPIGWIVLDWNGKAFLLDRTDVTPDVSYWMPCPPDPVQVKQ